MTSVLRPRHGARWPGPGPGHTGPRPLHHDIQPEPEACAEPEARSSHKLGSPRQRPWPGARRTRWRAAAGPGPGPGSPTVRVTPTVFRVTLSCRGQCQRSPSGYPGPVLSRRRPDSNRDRAWTVTVTRRHGANPTVARSDSLNISERARWVACLLGRTRGPPGYNPERPKNNNYYD